MRYAQAFLALWGAYFAAERVASPVNIGLKAPNANVVREIVKRIPSIKGSAWIMKDGVKHPYLPPTATAKAAAKSLKMYPAYNKGTRNAPTSPIEDSSLMLRTANTYTCYTMGSQVWSYM